MNEPIICPPQVDTFLAVTPVKPITPERPRWTEKQKNEFRRMLEECLEYPILYPPFDDKVTFAEKTEKLNAHLASLIIKMNLLLAKNANEEDVKKVQYEFFYFLERKNSLMAKQFDDENIFEKKIELIDAHLNDLAVQKESFKEENNNLEIIETIQNKLNFWQNKKESVETKKATSTNKSLMLIN